MILSVVIVGVGLILDERVHVVWSSGVKTGILRLMSS